MVCMKGQSHNHIFSEVWQTQFTKQNGLYNWIKNKYEEIIK